jgi:hypothetical protein
MGDEPLTRRSRAPVMGPFLKLLQLFVPVCYLRLEEVEVATEYE